jgi:hypothetical protein
LNLGQIFTLCPPLIEQKTGLRARFFFAHLLSQDPVNDIFLRLAVFGGNAFVRLPGSVLELDLVRQGQVVHEFGLGVTPVVPFQGNLLERRPGLVPGRLGTGGEQFLYTPK